MESVGIAFWVGDSRLISSHLFWGDRSLLNGSRAINSGGASRPLKASAWPE